MPNIFKEKISEYLFLEIENKNFTDLYLCYCGMQKCKPLYHYGPAIRNNYIIHFILEGTGYYYVNDTKYTITKNQGFLIRPNEVTFYQSDKNDPWTYIWIGFDGKKVNTYLQFAGLDNENLIFKYDNSHILKDYVLEMLNHHTVSNSNQLKIEALLYLFFSRISENITNSPIQSKNGDNIYILKCIEYIQNNYSNHITVSEVCKYVSLSRSYLNALFKKCLNISPQQFLIEFRMNKASELLKSTDLPINNISYSCGYTDPLAFSKSFKKILGISPSHYRNTKRTR